LFIGQTHEVQSNRGAEAEGMVSGPDRKDWWWNRGQTYPVAAWKPPPAKAAEHHSDNPCRARRWDSRGRFVWRGAILRLLESSTEAEPGRNCPSLQVRLVSVDPVEARQ